MTTVFCKIGGKSATQTPMLRFLRFFILFEVYLLCCLANCVSGGIILFINALLHSIMPF